MPDINLNRLPKESAPREPYAAVVTGECACVLLTPTGHQLVRAGRRPSKRCTAVRGWSGSMALAIVGQVGDFVPPPRRSVIGVIPLSRGCLLHPNVRQMRIMHPDIAFELSKQRTAVKRYIRECLSLVPRPTHALHLAPAIGPHDGICLPARHWPPRPRLALTARVGSSARWLGTLASDERHGTTADARR